MTINSATLSNLTIKPSFSNLINLASIYNTAGLIPTTIASATMVGDKLLASYGIKKHYISTGSFWGYIAYKAIKQIHGTEIDNQYKLLLDLFFIGSAAAMTKYGEDIFADKYDAEKLTKSISVTADFFDNNKVIAGLSEAYNESYSKTITYILHNYQPLITNKFVLYALASQTAEAGKLILTQKFLPAKELGELSIFLTLKENNPIQKIGKVILTNFINKLITLGHNQIQGKLISTIKQEINLRVADLAFDDENREKILKIDNIEQIANNLSSISQDLFTDLSSITRSLILPFATTNNFTNQMSIEEILNKFPSFILLNGLPFSVFSKENISTLTNYLQGIIFSNNSEQNKHTKFVLTQLPSSNLDIA